MQEKMRFHIESEQPGRNEAINEWLDEHRAIFTTLDENFPTPEEITSEEVLMLPEIQSMSAYIRQHFEEEIDRCNFCITAASPKQCNIAERR